MSSYFQKTVKVSSKEAEISQLVNEIIREVINTETDVDGLKVTLAENIRFDTADAFRSIDSNQKGYIIAEDIYRFLVYEFMFYRISKNNYLVNIKMCNFLVHSVTNGANQITYQIFLQMIIPRYDNEAAQTCIARKIVSDNQQQTLSFYLEETLATLLVTELEYLKSLETKKMRLAELVEWKFMTVYKLISTVNPNQSIDQQMLNNFMARYSFQKLSILDYQMFLKRFNRNDDKLLQRDEFSDAIFPNGYLLHYDSTYEKEDFEKYIKNQNQELDNYLGKTISEPNDVVAFDPDEHRFQPKKTNKLDSLVQDNQLDRSYMLLNPQQTVSNFHPQIQQQSSQQKIMIYEKEHEYQNNNNYISKPKFDSQWPDSTLTHYGINVQRETYQPTKIGDYSPYGPYKEQYPNQGHQSYFNSQEQNIYVSNESYYKPQTQQQQKATYNIQTPKDYQFVVKNRTKSQSNQQNQKDMLKEFMQPEIGRQQSKANQPQTFQQPMKRLEPQQKPNSNNEEYHQTQQFGVSSLTESMIQQYNNQQSNKDYYFQGQQRTLGYG